MNKRNIIIFLLLVIAAGFLYFTNKKEEEIKEQHNYVFKNLNFPQITSITLKTYVEKKPFTLKKDKSGKWSVNGVECNKYKIEYLINLLKKVDFKNVISSKKENYPNFQVDDKNAIKVIITQGKKKIKLWIGKFTPDGNGCYVRLENGNVYLIPNNLTFEFDKTKKNFYLEDKIKKKKIKKDNSTVEK